jgi:signal transduction histidine kinase/ActR/RegA family two-component response regulator
VVPTSVISQDFDSNLRLTAEEEKWLSDNDTFLVVSAPASPPNQFVNVSGEIDGIAGSYLKILSKKLNVQFVWSENQSWLEGLEMLEAHKADILTHASITEDRRRYLDFSVPYSSETNAIFTREGSHYSSLNELEGFRIALMEGVALTDYIVKNYPDIEVIYVDETYDALTLLLEGGIDAYVGSMSFVAYLMAKKGLGNIVVSGITSFAGEVHIGVRNELPLLKSAIDKALNSITESEHNAISREWRSLKIETEIDYSLIWKIAGIVLVVFLIILFWLNSLRKEIVRREKVEKDLIEMKEKADKAMHESEAANRAKSDFLANMSHEIRTPMSGVISTAELLKNTILDINQQSMVKTILQSGQALLTVTNDILDFSKIEAGKLVFDEIPVSLSSILEDTADVLSPSALNKTLNLITFVDPNIPDEVMADPVRIHQILYNLCGNAIKFTRTGHVIMKAVLIEQKENDAIVRFDVIDTGIGISPDAQKRLFSSFTQAESSTTRKYGGTGLGLTISQKLAEMMGSNITIESAVDVGSTFSLTLAFPIVKGKSQKDSYPELKGLNILQVAFTKELQDCSTQYLEYFGANITNIQTLCSMREMLLKAEDKKKYFDMVIIGPEREMELSLTQIKEFYKFDKETSKKFILIGNEKSDYKYKTIKNTSFVNANPLRRDLLINSVMKAMTNHDKDQLFCDKTPENKAISKFFDKHQKTIEEAEENGDLILVAEDNPTMQTVIAMQFKRLGYAYVIANDGVQALEMLDKHKISLLLTDCQMPNMDGYELTRQIRAKEGNTDYPLTIIAVTASAMTDEVEKCKQAGMTDVLTKPVVLDTLQKLLEKYMHSEPKIKVG